GLEGYRCQTASGGAEAMHRLTAGGYDLIVSDLRMPDCDGPGLFAWLVDARPEMIPAVAFSTGDTLGANAARFLGESSRPFMEKPFTLAAVRALVDAVDRARP
ncbi:MAG TPA: response regulator, partial [Sphingomonas sp.]